MSHACIRSTRCPDACSIGAHTAESCLSSVAFVFPWVLTSNVDSQDWMRAARLQTLEDDEGKRDVLKETPWQQMSWKTVNCCQKLDDDKVWEDEISGVPDCFCRDVLSRSRYKTTAVCNLRQVLVLDSSVCPCM